MKNKNGTKTDKLVYRQTWWVIFAGLMPDQYKLTDTELIIKKRKWIGLLDEEVTISYSKINSRQKSRGSWSLFAWLGKCGRIEIQSDDLTYKLPSVRRFGKFYKKLSEKIHNYVVEQEQRNMY